MHERWNINLQNLKSGKGLQCRQNQKQERNDQKLCEPQVFGKQKIILGLSWLKEHNLEINWKTGKLEWQTQTNLK